MEFRTFPEVDFIRAAFSIFQDALYASSFSQTQVLPAAWGFLPRPASLCLRVQCVKMPQGQPHLSFLAASSILEPVPDLPPLTVPQLPIPDASTPSS